MNVGSAFYIGKTHKICEDFASFGTIPEPYILLSDGCTSSPNTDFGARILVQISKDLISKGEGFNSDEIMIEADEIRRMLNLPEEALDATLLCAYLTGEKYRLHIFGDGISVKIRNDGNLEVVFIEYLSGAPFYPNYSLNLTRKNGYVDFFGLKKKISTYTLYPDGTVENLVLKEDIEGSSYYEEGLYNNYKAIILLSDGVNSFYQLLNTSTSRSSSSIELNEVLLKLLDFKSFQGEFVDRRFQKFCKDCEKLNWSHADDLSLATIFLGQTQ